MKVSFYALASASIFIASNSQAQAHVVGTPVGVVPAPIVAGTTDVSVLRAGTSVPLKMAESLTTKGKNLKVGQRFQLETAAPISVNGVTVIPVGSPATGEITEVRNKGMWGKSGRINARVLYLRANGRQIRLSGQLDDKGTTGTAGVVGAVALLPVAGFFMTGTSANIPLGAPVTAFIDEDIAVSFAGGAPSPMAVPANAAVVAPIASGEPRLIPAAAVKPSSK